MAKKAMINKANKPAKYSVREYTRCERCGRPHSVLRKYKLCRICFHSQNRIAIVISKNEIVNIK